VLGFFRRNCRATDRAWSVVPFNMRLTPRRSEPVVGLFRGSHRRRAFTLIELLTVIAILGILAALLFPTVGAALDRAKRAADGASVREIAKAAMIYAQDNDGRLPDPQNVPATTLTAPQRAQLWPGVIARNGILTDPKVYFSKVDPSYDSANPPLSIINTTDANKRSLDTSFTNNRSPSYEFVGGIRTSDPATTPVLFTRGLQATGLWSPTSGVYKDTGGFVAFLGGNVEFYSTAGTANTASAIFTSNNSGRKVADIRQGIPFTPTPARIYGIPPTGQAILGSAAGTLATRGP
jgi:prepilin-type N-terminal cleavage/methylation domain-containing protein